MTERAFDEQMPTTLEIMYSRYDMASFFLRNNGMSEELIERHIALVSPGAKASAKLVRDNILSYFGTNSRVEIEEDFERIKTWLNNPIPSSIIHGESKVARK